MKKIIAILAVMLLGFSLVGCITGDETGGGNTNTTVTLAQAQENVNNALKNIVFDDQLLNNVVSNLSLATRNARYPNVKFEWTSSEEDLVNPTNGEVTRPRVGKDDRINEEGYVPVTLTVVLKETATDGSVATATKSFELKVISINLDIEGTLLEIQQAAVENLVSNNVGINVNDKENVLNCLTYARVVGIFEGTFMISDGTYSMAVYGTYEGVVGDLVKVQGGVRSYYGLIEFADEVNFVTLPETDSHASITVCEYNEIEISQVIANLDAAIPADGKIADATAGAAICGEAYKLYAYVIKEDIGCGDTFALEDPLTGDRISIYHYATDADEAEALLDQYVGKYVDIEVFTSGRYSSNGIYRVLWNGEEPVEAEAPNLTDQERVDLAKASLALNASATGEYTLPTAAYGATISWELVDGGEVATLNENVLTVTQGTASYTIKVKATVTSGEVSEAVELTCLVAQEGPMPIGDALQLADGTAVVLKGKVKSIDTAWSDQYGNITVTIEDETGSIQLFRLATNVKVGQVIVVTGEMDSYNSNRQVAAGATAVLAGGEVTVAEAATLEDGAEVVLVGTVKSIDTPWSDQYGNITVTLEDETGTISLFRLATNVEAGAKIKVTGVVGSYNGVKQIAAGATAELVVEEQPVEPITIAEALALEDGAEVVVKGTVKSIDTPWSDQYSNISVTIEDETGSLYLFRLATKVEVGNVIVVTGVMATYNEARQIAAGATAEIVEDGGGDVVVPDPTLITIAEALAAADGTAVVVKGIVQTIDTAWNDQYNNISVTIKDETGSLYLFRLATKVEVGDEIKVTGTMATYNESRQVAAGATAEILSTGNIEAKDCLTISFADTSTRTSFSTSQQVWEENGITVTNDKAASTSNVADYAGPARFYKSSSLTIECEEAMTKIVINATGSTKYFLSDTTVIEGATVTYEDGVCTIVLDTPATSFTIAALGNQIRVSSIEVYN